MIHIAICDDNVFCVEMIAEYLKEYATEKHIRTKISKYNNPQILIMSKNIFDVIFLDIDMEEMNGLEVARVIRKTDTSVKIIYCTGYNEYMNSAFRVHAFGYIMKPIKREEIFHMMEEVVRYSMPKEDHYVKFLLKDRIKTFDHKDILYFEYRNRKIGIHTKEDKVYWIANEKISDIAKRMEYYQFAVPHKSFVVNLYHVDHIKGYSVYMVNEDEIPLSQNYSKEFRKRVEVLMKKRLIE